MSEKRVDLQKRTKEFAIRVIRLVDALPRNRASDVLGRQLIRCATSVGANYRSARRAQSPADFIAKMSIVEEEADESCCWMELLADVDLVKKDLLSSLMTEGNELVAIAVASVKTARSRQGSAIR